MSSDSVGPASPSAVSLDSLPDELLIQIFGQLAVVGNIWEDDDPLRLASLPYRQADTELLPCTGLRGYPFLAQVCRRWQRLLATPMAQQLVWRRVCVDFGHELVTSIHTPLRWSNQRPSASEYQAAFQCTTLSASKVLRFLSAVGPHVRSLSLANTEGFDGDDGEFVSLVDKHNFGASHFGFALAMLHSTLTELWLHHCNDLVTADSGVWTLAAQLPALRVLAVEGLRGVVPAAHGAALGELRRLEVLVVTGADYRSDWAVGLDGLPPGWSRLTSLTRLELRGHSLLTELPAWLPCLAALRHLDLSGCCELALGGLPQVTQLHVLALQNLCLGHVAPTPEEVDAAARAGQLLARRALPDLQLLGVGLRSLSLAGNRFSQLPEWLPRLTRLEHLDLSYNKDLHIRTPLNGLASLPYISLLDFRSVHLSKDSSYWCEAKCNTMQHLSKLAKALKRRWPQPRLLLDI